MKDLKKGERVNIEAEKAEEAGEPLGMKDEAGEQPMPLTTNFHVTGINKARAKAPAPAKGKGPTEYLKSKRAPVVPAGSDAADMA